MKVKNRRDSQFGGWLDAFIAYVDHQNLSDLHKWMFLKDSLKGKAWAKISGLPDNYESYTVAMNVLCEIYMAHKDTSHSLLSSLSKLDAVKSNLSNLEDFTDAVRAAGHSLRAQGLTEDALDVLVPSLFNKLPTDLSHSIEERRFMLSNDRKNYTAGTKWSFKQFIEALQLEQSIKPKNSGQSSMVHLVSTNQQPQPARHETPKETPRGNKNQTHGKKLKPCFFCEKGNHYNDACRTVNSLEERRKIVQTKRACYACLGSQHTVQQCKAKRKCVYCSSSGHNRALCPSRDKEEKKNEKKTKPDENKSSGSKESTASTVVTSTETKQQCLNQNLAHQHDDSSAIMPTMPVILINKHTGKQIEAFALIDGGAQCTSILQSAANQLELLPSQKISFKTAVFGGERKDMEAYSVSFTMVGPTGYSIELNAWSVPSICLDIVTEPPNFGEETKRTLIENDVVNMPTEVSESLPISLLLGQDYANFILHNPGSSVLCLKGSLRLHRTPFGNILSGDEKIDSKISKKKFKTARQVILNNTMQDVQKLWSIETIGIGTDDNPTKDSKLNTFFEQSVKRLDNGRYEVCLPFKSNPFIESNRQIAYRRLEYTIKKLCPDMQITDQFRQYHEILMEQLNTGIIEEVDPNSTGVVSTYVSHFPVIKESSKTTRVRIVMNLDNNLIEYRYTRVCFGLTVSPWLLLATIEYHMKSNPCQIADRLKDNIYMDNGSLSAETEKEVYETYIDTKEFFKTAQMNAREFQSNFLGLQQMIPAEDREKSEEGKVLCFKWDTKTDTVRLNNVKIIPRKSTVVTKRIVLQGISLLFDPFSLFCPVTIRGRILMQELWKNDNGKKEDWDIPLSKEKSETWLQLQQDIHEIPEISFPRRIVQDSSQSINLYMFCDASQSAFGFVIYANQQHGKPAIVFAKGRVAPLKPSYTVPRLELMALLVGFRALRFVQLEMKHPVQRRVVFTDSAIALQQIKNGKNLPGWTTRRCDEIQSIASELPAQIYHIPGSSNVADLVTRGISLSELKTSEWFTGPHWLLNEDDWPISKELSGLSQEEQIVVNLAQIGSVKPAPVCKYPFEIQIQRYSNFSKLVRVTAYCFRAIKTFKKENIETQFLSSDEIKSATEQWIRFDQGNYFQETIDVLLKNKQNQLIKQMDLFLDGSNIIRCGSRLLLAPIPYTAKFPALLSKQSKLTELIVDSTHQRILHYGARATLTEIRQQYWIPQGLSCIQKILRDCVVCRKYGGKPFKPPPYPNLPIERVSQAPCFHFCAMDFLGPISVRFPKSKQGEFEKIYIAVFNCFSTRAIHLEVVFDCSTESTIKALERFISRRGTPRILYTDNQASFKKGAKIIQEIFQKASQEENFSIFFSQKGIDWKFSIESAAWTNAISEISVKLVKSGLMKTMHRTVMGIEDVITLVTKVEGICITRPLLFVSVDNNDTILCPASFMAPNTQLGLPPWDENSADPDWNPNSEDLLKSYKKGLRKIDNYWKIHLKRYLQELKEVQRRHFPKVIGEVDRCPTVGEVCLLQEDDPTPRLHWPLVRVLELIQSKNDDEIRFAKIRLPSGRETRRSVRELIPLEATLEKTNKTENETKNQLLNFLPKPSTIFPLPKHLLAFVLFMLITTTQSVGVGSKFQICTSAPSGRRMKFPEKIKCTIPTRSEHISTDITLYTPNERWPNGTAYLCYIQRTTICATVGFFGGEPILSPGTCTKKPTTVDECRLTAHSLKYEEDKLVQDEIFSSQYSTNKKVKIKSAWWDTKCNFEDNFILEIGEIASKDGKSIVSNLPHVDHCKLENGSCLLKDATLVWSIRSIARWCPYTKKGVYTAKRDHINGKLLTVPQTQSAFHLTSIRGASIHRCLPKKSYLTKEKAIIYFGKEPGHKKTEIDDQNKLENATSKLEEMRKGIALTSNVDPMNSKLNFLLTEISESIEMKFREDHYQFCLLAQREQELAIQFLKLSPIHGIRAILQREDITAEYIDQELVVHKCLQIKADEIIHSHKDPNSDSCFEFLPVIVKGKIWFSTPGSMDLITASPKISCHEIHEIRQSVNPHMPKMEIPNALLPLKENFQFPVFKTSSLFKSRIAFPEAALRTFSSHVLTIDQRLRATINYTTMISTDPNAMREAILAVGEAGGRFVEHAGLGIGHIIEGTLDGFGKFTAELLSPIYFMGLSFIVFIHSIIIIAFGSHRLKLFLKRYFRVRKIRQELRIPERAMQTDNRTTVIEDTVDN